MSISRAQIPVWILQLGAVLTVVGILLAAEVFGGEEMKGELAAHIQSMPSDGQIDSLVCNAHPSKLTCSSFELRDAL